MITVKSELNSVASFDAWSGGKAVLNQVIAKNRVDELDELLEEKNQDWTDTQLNDFLWFELEEMDGWKNLWDDEEDEDEDEE